MKAAGTTGKSGWRVGCLYRSAEQVSMAKMHRDQHEAPQQERQKQRQAATVVESRDEHEQQQHAKPHPGTGWQDVKPAPLERQRQSVRPLAAPAPGRHPSAEEAPHGAEDVRYALSH